MLFEKRGVCARPLLVFVVVVVAVVCVLCVVRGTVCVCEREEKSVSRSATAVSRLHTTAIVASIGLQFTMSLSRKQFLK